jgi:hemerythrin
MVDRQHQELFERVGRLLDAGHAHRSPEEIRRLLDFLGDYVVEHFAAEERLMVEGAYPGLPSHRAEHEDFVREFAKLYEEFRSVGAGLGFVVRFSGRVTAWLREHIYRTDRTMAAWLRDRAGEA